MLKAEIFSSILNELKNSKKDFRWPEHIVAQAALVSSSAGSLLKEAIRFKYSTGDVLTNEEGIQLHAIETAALCLRFLQNLNHETDIKRNTDNQGANSWQESSTDSNGDEVEHQMDSREVEKS